MGTIGAVGGAIALATSKIILSSSDSTGATGASGLPSYVREQLTSPAEKSSYSNFKLEDLLDLQTKMRKKGKESFENGDYEIVNACVRIQQLLSAIISSREKIDILQSRGDMSSLSEVSKSTDKLQRQLAEMLADMEDSIQDVDGHDKTTDQEDEDEVEGLSEWSSQETLFGSLKRKVGLCKGEENLSSFEAVKPKASSKQMATKKLRKSSPRSAEKRERKRAKKSAKKGVLEPVWAEGMEPKEGEFIEDIKGNKFYMACEDEKVGVVASKVLSMLQEEEGGQDNDEGVKKTVDDVLNDIMESNALKYEKRSLKNPESELIGGTLLAVPPTSWEEEEDDDESC